MSTAQHRLALPAGFKLGRYRLESILGSGGFGITYLAQDQSLNRRVAIKELLPNDIATRVDGTTVVAKTESEEKSLTWARDRFMDEGRALAACDHPNVVNVYEMVEANGTAYMVTKYEEGRSLEQWLQELGRRPNESELRSVLMPLLSGLETVHQAGFLHRDIKPDNIYMTKNGRPLLLDFGSARQAISNRSMAMTSIVTSGYAPFEQYHDDGKQGAWSDIYALAAVMYRAISGKKPPDATRRLKDDPCENLASRYAGQYSPQFLRAIDRGLAVDESKRPQSVADWRKMFGAEPTLAADSDETRVLPRAPKVPAKSAALMETFAGGRWKDLLQHRRMLDVGVPVAVVLLLAIVWMATHSSSHAQNKGGSLGLVTLLPKSSPSGDHPSTGETSPAPSAAPSVGPEIQPSPSAGPAVATQLDPRLVGIWETAHTSRSKRVRWEQAADGHYTFSGAAQDAGVISGSDGKMKQFSNGTQQPIDLTYQFNGAKLVTTNSTGSTEWQHVGDSSSSASGSSRQRSGRGVGAQPTVRPGDVGRELINRVFRKHFP